MNIIAVDTGNRYIKTAHAKPFSAGLNRHYDSPPPMATDVLFYNGEYYSFSETQGSHRHDKTVDDQYFILTLAAMARELIMKRALGEARDSENINFDKALARASKKGLNFKEDVVLAMGLPPAHLEKLRERFKNYFLSKGEPITFEYNDVKFCVTVKSVFVFPQGYAAVMPRDIQKQVRDIPQAYVIDIGGYTTDVILMINGKPDPSFYRSFSKGVIHLYNTIAGCIAETYQTDINGVLIEAVLKGKSIGAPEIEEMVRYKAEEYAKDLVLFLKDNGVDLTLSKPVLVGGGAQLMAEPLKKSIAKDNIILITDVRANAIGYEYCAEKMLKNDRALNKT